MAVWPTTLPQTPLIKGRNIDPDENRLVTKMATGAPKIRILYSSPRDKYTIRLVITTAQVSILKAFYSSTIEFTWVDPLTKAAANCRILNRPTYSPVGSGLYATVFPMEVVLI